MNPYLTHRKGLYSAIYALGASAILTGSASAALMAYEGFNYPNAIDLDGSGYPGGNPGAVPEHLRTNNGGSGFSTAWDESTYPADVGDDWFVVKGDGSDSLVFGDLATSGNRVSFRDNLDSDNAFRSLSSSIGTSGTGEIYFSILVNPIERQTASRGGFAITDVNLANGAIENTTTGVQGIGFGSPSNHNWRAYAWDGTSRINGSAQLSTTLNQTYLLVGHLSFNTGTGGADEYTLYNYQLNAGSVVGGTLNAIGATIEVDLNENDLGLINLNRQRKFDADEIRIGESLGDVVFAIPEPSSSALVALGGLLMIGRRRRKG